MDKKFCNSRYITRGIQSEVPIAIQAFLWKCIESLQEEMELDYLQVFDIKSEKEEERYIQIIEHEQEVPKYRMTYRLSCTELIKAKVFVIDDGDFSAMLLSEEY
jgi:hypothetical protein